MQSPSRRPESPAPARRRALRVSAGDLLDARHHSPDFTAHTAPPTLSRDRLRIVQLVFAVGVLGLDPRGLPAAASARGRTSSTGWPGRVSASAGAYGRAVAGQRLDSEQLHRRTLGLVAGTVLAAGRCSTGVSMGPCRRVAGSDMAAADGRRATRALPVRAHRHRPALLPVHASCRSGRDSSGSPSRCTWRLELAATAPCFPFEHRRPEHARMLAFIAGTTL
ncbi:MAG: hypothetical protein U5L11_13010 [Arhodomonas sp.]|nr:hypothetical protein [Arhodomonas sp.]